MKPARKPLIKSTILAGLMAAGSIGAAQAFTPIGEPGAPHNAPEPIVTPLTGPPFSPPVSPPIGGPIGTPPGQDPEFVPPGQDPEFVPPGHDPGFTPPGRSAENRMRGGSAGNFRGGPSGRAGLSSIARLGFTLRDTDGGEIDPLAAEPLMDGAWGLLIYRWIALEFDYIFNGHQLPDGTDYTLAYLPQSEESNGNGETVFFLDPDMDGVICLGSGIVNEEGNLNLQGTLDIETDLPAEYDANEDEAMLALLPSEHVNCEGGVLDAWFPDNYLFGVKGMFYVVSDGMPPHNGGGNGNGNGGG